MHSRTLLLVMILILFGSLFFLFQPDPPERVSFVSGDGNFQVHALVYDKPNLQARVAQDASGASTARVSPVYEVTGTWAHGEEVGASVELTSDLDPSKHALAYWDSDIYAWVSVEADYVHIENDKVVFSSSGSLPAKWALFQRQEVEAPRRYEQIVADLIEHRPENADRMVIRLAYAFEENDYVAIRSARVTGACGGNLQFSSGPKEIEEVVERSSIKVNGYKRYGWIRVRAEWDLGDGCEEDEVFERVE